MITQPRAPAFRVAGGKPAAPSLVQAPMSVNWTRDAAAHLLRRAGFGGTPAEIDALYARGLEGAVSFLVDYDTIDLAAYESALTARNYNLTRVTGLVMEAVGLRLPHIRHHET